jgi:predicted RNase H-like HicB family nuclease
MRIEYIYDDEAGSWHFAVPALHIVGGGPSKDDARARAREAIKVALEMAEEDTPVAGAEVEYVDLTG